MITSSWILKASKEADSTISLGNLCQDSVTLIGKKCLTRNLPSFRAGPLALVLLLCTTEKSRALSSLLYAFRNLYKLIRSPKPSVLQAEQSELSQSFPTGEMLWSLHHLSHPWLVSLQYVHVSLGLRSPDLDTELRHVSPALSRWQGSSPSACWQYSAQCTLA